MNPFSEISTHRVLQLSQVEDALAAISFQCEHAATNAGSIGNSRVASDFTSRAGKARIILTKVQARLAEAELARTTSDCKSRIELPVPRRPANALNVEIGTPAPRCLNKRPTHWPHTMSAIRWMASGGDALVFGRCSRNCPLRAKGSQNVPLCSVR